jgi:cytochrome c biogenesis protein CcmG/thiol:disulfide interchange protein DsbE
VFYWVVVSVPYLEVRPSVSKGGYHLPLPLLLLLLLVPAGPGKAAIVLLGAAGLLRGQKARPLSWLQILATTAAGCVVVVALLWTGGWYEAVKPALSNGEWAPVAWTTRIVPLLFISLPIPILIAINGRMSSHWAKRVGGASVLSLLLLMATGQRANAAVLPAAQRKPAAELALPDTKGQTVDLASYKGRVVLLDFWATWCGGCKVEIPWYMEFDKRYRGRGLEVVGVAMDDDGMKVVLPFVKEKGIEYTILAGNEAVAKQFAVEAMPVTLLIDREGRVAATHVGVVNRAEFESELVELLK